MLDILVNTDFRPTYDFKWTTLTFSITHLLNRRTTKFKIVKTLLKPDLITNPAQNCQDSNFLTKVLSLKWVCYLTLSSSWLSYSVSNHAFCIGNRIIREYCLDERHYFILDYSCNLSEISSRFIFMLVNYCLFPSKIQGLYPKLQKCIFPLSWGLQN